MQRTRGQILEILKRQGTASLEELAAAIGLVSVTVRSHLSILERDGLIQTEEERGKVGRPHFLYSLTPAGQEFFPRAYDVLADRLLVAAREVYGPEGVDRLLQQLWDRWVDQRRGRMVGKDLQARVAAVAQMCSEEGSLSEWRSTPQGLQLRLHNCLTFRVSTEHHKLCDNEQSALRRLLEARVERLSCMASGDVRCAFLVTPE